MNRNIRLFTSNNMLDNAKRFMKVKQKKIEEIFLNNLIFTELYALRNIVQVIILIIEQSIERKENKGVFLMMIL